MELIPDQIELQPILKDLSLEATVSIFTQLLDVVMMFHASGIPFDNEDMVKTLLESVSIRQNLSTPSKKQITLDLRFENHVIKHVKKLCKKEDFENEKKQNVWNMGHLLYKLILKDNAKLKSGEFDEEKVRSEMEEGCNDRNMVDLVMHVLDNDETRRPTCIAEIIYSPHLMRYNKMRYFMDIKSTQSQTDRMKNQLDFYDKLRLGIKQLVTPLVDNLTIDHERVKSLDNSISPRKTPEAIKARNRRSLRVLNNSMDEEIENTLELQDKSSPRRKNTAKGNMMVGMFKNKLEVQMKPSHDPKDNVNMEEYFQMVLKQQKVQYKFDTGCKHNYFSISNQQRSLTILQNKIFGAEYYTARCEQKVTPLNNEISFKIEKINPENDIVIGITSRDNDSRISKKSGVLGSKRVANSYGVNFLTGQAGCMDVWRKYTKAKLLRDKCVVTITFDFDKRCLRYKVVFEDSITTDLGVCFEDSLDLKVEWFFAVSLFKEKSAVTILN